MKERRSLAVGDYQAVLKQMSPNLRGIVTMKINGKWIKKLRMFHGAPLSFFYHLSAALDQVGWCRLTVSKPLLKAPGTKRFKLKYNQPPSKFAFEFNLRCYDQVVYPPGETIIELGTMVGLCRCRLTL